MNKQVRGPQPAPPLCSWSAFSPGNPGMEILPWSSPLQLPAGGGVALLLASEVEKALTEEQGLGAA